MTSGYKRTWTGADGRERARWVAAYRDRDGRRHNKWFMTRKDAKAFLVLTEGEIARGSIRPKAPRSPAPQPPICGSNAARGRSWSASSLGNKCP